MHGHFTVFHWKRRIGCDIAIGIKLTKQEKIHPDRRIRIGMGFQVLSPGGLHQDQYGQQKQPAVLGKGLC